MNRTDIDYIIEKLESYKPDNIYDGYNSIREKQDQRVSEVLDSIIEEIKIEPVEESKWIKCSDRMPEDNIAVNIIWANRAPVGYYANIKDKPFVDTAVYYKGIWYWWSVVVQDILGEYGKAEGWEIDSNIDVIAWVPLPEPPKVK